MRRAMPKIREFMVKTPHTIGSDIPLPKAREMMQKFKIRHLPVQYGGKLVGVLSDRNIQSVISSDSPNKFFVEDIMIPDPFVVEADTPMDMVASIMAEEKFGCTIVTEDEKVVGIFTTVDACRALRQILETVYLE